MAVAPRATGAPAYPRRRMCGYQGGSPGSSCANSRPSSHSNCQMDMANTSLREMHAAERSLACSPYTIKSLPAKLTLRGRLFGVREWVGWGEG